MRFYWKDIVRTIFNSLGRFLSILGIIALGVGFYGALRMTSYDMKILATDYFRDTNFMDIRVVSSLGLSQENINSIMDIDGVDGLMPCKETDVLASVGHNQIAIRIHSLNNSVFNDKVDSQSVSDNNYINKVDLVSGAWPSSNNECVVLSDSIIGKKTQLGDEIEIIECSNGFDETLIKRKLKISGFVSSPYYMYTLQLGTSNLGSGEIEQVIYVPESQFKESYPDTEIFITVENAKNYVIDSDQYYECVDSVIDKIKEIASDQTIVRSNQIRYDAQKQLDNGWHDYNQKKDSIDKELDANEKKLNSSNKTLQDKQNELSRAEAELNLQLHDFENQKQEVYSQIETAFKNLDKASNIVEDLEAKNNNNNNDIKLDINQVKTDVDQAESGLASIIFNLNKSKQISDNSINLLNNIIEKPEIQSQITAAFEYRLSVTNDLLDNSQKFYEDIMSASAEDKQKIYYEHIGSFILTSSIFQLSYEPVSIAFSVCHTYLENYYNQIKNKENEANNQFNQFTSLLQAARLKIEDGKNQLYSGTQEYKQALNTYNDLKEQAYQGLNDAETKLNNSKKEIDSLQQAEFYVIDRTKNLSYISYIGDTDRIDAISKVFPLVFFIVAALVALTSMTRMVEEERVLIGTYKALGLSKFSISMKFIIYGLFASILGSLIGLIVIPQIIPYVILYTYQIIYHIPFSLPMPFNIGIAVIATVAGIFITLGATIFSSYFSLKEVPASLMLPSVPKAGKQILLEKVKPLWNMFNFNWHITLRNMFLFKKRFFMTIIGIAGCTALLLTGMGLYSSINNLLDKQYNYIIKDNFYASFNDDITQENIDILNKDLINDTETKNYSFVNSEGFMASPSNTADVMLTAIVPEDVNSFKNLRLLQNRVTKEQYELNDDCVYITEKLATLLNVKSGDTIRIYEPDSIGNASLTSYDIKIDGISENYLAHYLYMNKNTYEKVFNKPFKCNAFVSLYSGNTQQKDKYRQQIQNLNCVKVADFSDKKWEEYSQTIDSVNTVVWVLIVSAAILAFIVLFNLTNINICERHREIATLKVLGSTSFEINAYIHRETVIVTMLGAIVGVIFGLFLENFVILSAEIDYCMFSRDLSFSSILFAVLITCVFAIVVLTFMRGKLKSISMVESLKSAE